MPKNISVQNNFIAGLKTEFTGLNFPENAATDTQNCVFTLIGDVTRRLGIDLEENFEWSNINTASSAISSYRWKNAGGDGETEILVLQVGNTLYFYQSTNSTISDPLSTTQLSSTVTVSSFQASGNTNSVAIIECQYASGNGYLFVFHPDCDPFYCTFNSGTVVANRITIQIRDFLGYYPEPGNPSIDSRSNSYVKEHYYNLLNQGWTGAPAWTATSTSTGPFSLNDDNGGGCTIPSGVQTFTVASGISSVIQGQSVSLVWTASFYYEAEGTSNDYLVTVDGTANGVVFDYSGTTMQINVYDSTNPTLGPGSTGPVGGVVSATLTVTPGAAANSVNTFLNQIGVYPANSDIWYTFKDYTNTFNPLTTIGSVIASGTPAPRGRFILDVFNQNQTGVSGVDDLTNLSTIARPGTGTWFQGRVWYTGVNGSQAAQGDQSFYTWSENIYFSQVISLGDTTSFGYCYQTNDPTDEKLFDLLPTDGGVITIAGCGNIYKLFPIQNGLLVFATNGIWFITGSTGIGFSATDYTITKISSVQSINSTSFVEVMGLPFFWNEEGIYRVTPAQGQGMGLAVEPITVGTILSFYNSIPLDSKVYVRGDYDPINYVIKWVYRSTQEAGISNRYSYDSVLNFNIYNRAFYPYSISSTSSTPYVNGIFYLNYTNSLTAPNPSFKYIASFNNELSFAEESDNSYLDWNAVSGQDYTSYFTTGYSLQGKGVFKHQPIYVYMYSRNDVPFSYTIQGRWDYAISGNSGKWSSLQTVVNGLGQPNFGMVYRRHKIRGHGEVLQLNISSVQGQPFDIMGWTIPVLIDAGL